MCVIYVLKKKLLSVWALPTYIYNKIADVAGHIIKQYGSLTILRECFELLKLGAFEKWPTQHDIFSCFILCVVSMENGRLCSFATFFTFKMRLFVFSNTYCKIN